MESSSILYDTTYVMDDHVFCNAHVVIYRTYATKLHIMYMYISGPEAAPKKWRGTNHNYYVCCGRRGHSLLGGSGGMPPRKVLKFKAILECF